MKFGESGQCLPHHLNVEFNFGVIIPRSEIRGLVAPGEELTPSSGPNNARASEAHEGAPQVACELSPTRLEALLEPRPHLDKEVVNQL